MSRALFSFTRNMSSLLGAGLGLTDALSVCADADKNTSGMALFIRGKVMEGKSLHEAAEEYNLEVKKEFSGLYTALLKIGERSGRTEEVFARLSEYLERRNELGRKTVQALIYPAMVLLMTIAASVFVATFVMPKIMAVMETLSAGKEAAFETKKAGAFSLLAPLVVFFSAIVAALVSRFFSERSAFMQDALVMRLPVVSRIVRDDETRNFSFAVSTMSAGGIPVSEALEESSRAARNRWCALMLSDFAKRVGEGASFSEAASQCPVLPAFVRTWLSIGERTGDMEKSFSEIYRYYDLRSESSRSVAASLLEPTLILVAGAAVMAFVLRVVVPVFGAIGGF